MQSFATTSEMEIQMIPAYKRNAPLIRLAFLAAALLITLSIGGFIDLLAASHVADAGHGQPTRAVLLASR
jgi:hypothetical protein